MFTLSQQILLCSGPHVQQSPYFGLDMCRSFLCIISSYSHCFIHLFTVVGGGATALTLTVYLGSKSWEYSLPSLFPLHLQGREENVCLHFNLTCISLFSSRYYLASSALIWDWVIFFLRNFMFRIKKLMAQSVMHLLCKLENRSMDL